MTASLPIKIVQRAETGIELSANHARLAVFANPKGAMGALHAKKNRCTGASNDG